MITIDELRALPDDKFSRAMAELAGWSVRVWQAGTSRWWNYVVTDANGDIVAQGFERSELHATQAAWENADFATDLNVAWALCEPTFAPGVYRYGADECHAEIQDNDDVVYAGYHRHPARALSIAWAALKLAQMAKEAEA